MNAAAYLLILRKRELLDPFFILIFTCFGGIGVLLGLTVATPSTVSPKDWPAWTVPSGLCNIIFSTTILLFAIAYFYSAEVLAWKQLPKRLARVGSVFQIGSNAAPDERQVSAAAKDESQGESAEDPRRRLAIRLMIASAVLGGILSAQVGSGSDIALYVFGVFGWNTLVPHAARTETELVASSVVVMGLLSLFTSLARVLNGGFDEKILLCWGADAFIVVLGAPIGSLVLTPAASTVLRRLFYVLALVQFVSYVYMEEAFYDKRYAPYIGTDVWYVLVPLFTALLLALFAHHLTLRRQDASAQPSLV